MGKFKLFSYNPPKKGVSKQDERASVQTDFMGFFYMLGRKFWNLSNLNLLMAVYIVVLIGGMWALSGIPWAFWTFLAVEAVLFGLLNVGTTYITRGYVRGDPVYILSDFKYALKQNWKQGILLGLIDLLVVFLLVFDIFFWMGPIDLNVYLEQSDGTHITADDAVVSESNDLAAEINGEEHTIVVSSDEDNLNVEELPSNEDAVTEPQKQSFLQSVSFYGCLALLLIYFMMRNYVYIIAVTFKLSIFKILKNSFIFAFVGLKRNIMAVLGILFALAVNFTIFVYLPVIGIVFPLIITTSLCSFIGAYAAYPVIKKYMITPYYEDEEVNEAYDKVFVDRE